MSNALTKVLAPPKKPLQPATTWAQLEQLFRTPVPSDVKWLMDTYGQGKIADFIALRDPRRSGWLPWAAWKISTTATHAATKSELFFPAPNGLFPFATTDNGDELFARGEGEGVVVVSAREPRREDYPGAPSAFLQAILSGDHVCGLFPSDFRPKKARFVEHKPFAVVRMILETATPYEDLAKSFKKHLGKAKSLGATGYSMSLEKDGVTYEMAKGGGQIGMNVIVLPDDETAVRATLRAFFASSAIRATNIADQAGNAIWSEGI